MSTARAKVPTRRGQPRKRVNIFHWQRVKGRSPSRETVYMIIDHPAETASPALLAAYVRRHWPVENKVHHVRDVSFGKLDLHGFPRQNRSDRDHAGALWVGLGDLVESCGYSE